MIATARRLALHGLRVALLAAIIAAIHLQHHRLASKRSDESLTEVSIERLRDLFPDAAAISSEPGRQGERDVLDATGRRLGRVLQTSPDSDHIIGFSGPTNVLVAFGTDDRIVGIRIHSSGDTRDHVKQVETDGSFLASFTGFDRKQAIENTDTDAVSGATLTSRAIQESVIHRLGGKRPSLRFSSSLSLGVARALFASAARLDQDGTHPSLWHATGEAGAELGTILRTSPVADGIIGYGGPTDTVVGFGPDGRIVGIALHHSYDNEPYVTYVREDEHFLTLFNGLDLDGLAELDLAAAEVEGVSGATMTSLAVAEGLVRAAREHRDTVSRASRSRRSGLSFTVHDAGAALTIAAGLVIGLTRLRSRRGARFVLRVALVAYLGLTTGSLLSQAMIVGWAQYGIPWRSAPGLVLLSAASLLVPLTSRRNIYCSHLCPHGAAQQLLRRRLPWRLRLPRTTACWLALLPALLLLWCLAVPMLPLEFSLIDIEPFDAWVFRVAGWATITIAIVGLIASLFVPMAYCRYGCPTGALLGFLRLRPGSEHWNRRDWFAVVLTVLALGALMT